MRMFAWERVSEYTTTLFGSVALFMEASGDQFKFRRDDKTEVGPTFLNRFAAMKYAGDKGWNIALLVDEAP
jgi:hypothetical protein